MGGRAQAEVRILIMLITPFRRNISHLASPTLLAVMLLTYLSDLFVIPSPVLHFYAEPIAQMKAD